LSVFQRWLFSTFLGLSIENKAESGLVDFQQLVSLWQLWSDIVYKTTDKIITNILTNVIICAIVGYVSLKKHYAVAFSALCAQPDRMRSIA